MYQTLPELQEDIRRALYIKDDEISIKNNAVLRGSLIDKLVMTAMFSSNSDLLRQSRRLIKHIARLQGISPASIYPFYMAIAEGRVKGLSVPAINIRTLTYDTARVIFSLAKKHHIGAFILEIARSEMAYTEQPPALFALAVLAAAIKEDYQGPLFLQGDHFQVQKAVFVSDPKKEIQAIEKLVDEAIAAQFYNIDIDASTIVDLSQSSLLDQQKQNSQVTAHFTNYIRRRQPKKTIISIGGEIGHIGDTNSTVADFDAFMTEYLKKAMRPGLSKVSVQTGTSHGGTPLPDGRLAQKHLDFSILTDIGGRARSAYHMAGAVQHGASTLPEEDFPLFPQAGTLEVHLSTGFQNIVFATLPQTLQAQIDTWLETNQKDSWEKGWDRTQFLYKTRKRALGAFKKELWSLREEEKEPIRQKLSEYLTMLFESLNVYDTKNIVEKYLR